MPDGPTGPLLQFRFGPALFNFLQQMFRQHRLAARFAGGRQAIGEKGDRFGHAVQLHIARRIGGELPHSPGRAPLTMENQLGPESLALRPPAGIGRLELHHPLLPQPQHIVDLPRAESRGIDQVVRLQLTGEIPSAT